MQDITIDITAVAVEADLQTQQARHQVVQRLDNLGHITADDGQINPGSAQSWQVSINGGAAVPLADFAISPPEGESRALVSLVVPADAVSVGRSPASAPAPASEQARPLRTWGDPTIPDPRASIPGWPGLGEQVANNANRILTDSGMSA